jgi:hypothetical protein
MTIIVDMSIENNYSITIMAGSQAVATPRYIYLVGSPEGWAGPTEDQAEHYANWRLVDKTESGVYTGTFDMPAAPMFRFYTALTGWDADSYGSQEDDNPIDYSITDGSFNGSLVKGKGSFNFPDWPGGQLTISVDMNNSTVSIKAGA